ncbi:uncharacterized protein LOC141630054 [Silene latifolia]|uniref:uncharacterized protein LOC141630054 n=1 Tax=Silene latifolia TaxID=37657 RepID=UPI003D787115
MTSVSSAAAKTAHLGLPHFCGIDSVGHSGGLLLRWDDSVVLSSLDITPHFILCTVSLGATHVCTKKDMYMMFIYGEPSFEFRLPLWNAICDLISGLSPFIIIGDFNQVELHSDKLGGSNVIRGQQEFTTWRLDNSLLDVPFFGPPFTWFNNRSDDQLIMKRLDRAYANNDWLHLFPAASILNLPILVSDHAPIILKLLPNSKAGRRPYRLDNWCFSSPEIANIVECAWRISFPSSPMYVLSHRLSSVRFSIMQWVIHHRLSHDIACVLATTCKVEEQYFGWSTIETLKFPCQTEELLCSTPPQDPASPRGFIEPLLESLDLPQLSSEDCLVLSAPFTALDIIHALNGMDGSKSPGPDGITPKFFQTFWPQVGHLVTMALLRFLNSGVMLKEWNNTHIVLIPKVDKPEMISQYRPIGLCNVIYRLASKCLANRLKLVISSIVSDSQQAFVPSQLMSDGCLITHEIMHYLNKTKKGTVSYAALKLDMHKAFDHVSWPFLFAIMKKFGFPLFWQNIIWECISTVTYNILINGEPSRSFRPSCGLRQGDPLSPYLFIMCMEILSCQLRFAEKAASLHGFKISRPNAPADFKSHMSSILKMRTSDSFGNYLGVPIDLPSKKSLVFQPLLDKMTSRIIAWPSGLLAKFMLPKYRKDLPIPASRSKVSHPSFLWSALCRTAHAFDPGFTWKLGNGSSVNLLTSPWINGTTPSVRHFSTDASPRLSSLLTPSGDWNPVAVYRWFQSPCANTILAMEPPYIDIDDFLYCKYTEDGVYTVRSGYDFLLSRIPFSCSPYFFSAFPWKVLWGLRCSPKFTLLVWRIVHSILPSLEILSTRGIQVSTFCVFCHSHAESLNHLFRSCTMARHVCLSSPLGINSVANPSVCLQRWLADFIGYFHRVTDAVDQCLLRFLCIIKAIWMIRNSVIFDNCKVNPSQILHMADYLFTSHSQLPVLWHSFVKNTNKISIFPLDNSMSLPTVTYFILVCRSSPRDRFIVTSSDSISRTLVTQHVRASSVFAASTKVLLLNMY